MGIENTKSYKLAANTKLNELFNEQLEELYWIERKLSKLLGKMNAIALTKELKDAFTRHQDQTHEHVMRLEKVFYSIQMEPKKSKSSAMAGIIAEAEEIIEETEEDSCGKDVALILVAQKAKHYEIACYGGLAQLAETMGYVAAKTLLRQTLEEEKQTDTLLTLIAESGINQKASQEVPNLQHN